jgi:hypothetical protein
MCGMWQYSSIWVSVHNHMSVVKLTRQEKLGCYETYSTTLQFHENDKELLYKYITLSLFVCMFVCFNTLQNT